SDKVLSIRGDAADESIPRIKNGTFNKYAVDLVEQVKNMNRGQYLEEIVNAQQTDFCVGVAGYPEKHFEAPNLDFDIQMLKNKVDQGGDYIVTQMFFDNEAYFRFASECREAGIQCPIVPGLKVLTREQHLNFLPKFFHLNIPEALTEDIQANPTRAREIGIEWGVQQCTELLEGGAPGIHFYIMGDPRPALSVIDNQIGRASCRH